MNINRIKRRLKSGERVICIHPHFSSLDLTEYLGYLGFDSIFIDCEHGTFGASEAGEMVRACEVANVSPLVRVPSDLPWIILKYLETGAQSILVPHVTSNFQARQVYESIKYAPLGKRGAHNATRAAKYGLELSSEEYFEHANNETLVGIMLEDVAAFENLDEILRVERIDLFVIGQLDLSMSMGIPGQTGHPLVQKRIENALINILDAGKVAGTTAKNEENVKRIFQQGFQFAIVDAASLLAERCKQFIEEVRHI
jgi:4-hydroxy-2-oxoheptanedioate aldolase